MVGGWMDIAMTSRGLLRTVVLGLGLLGLAGCASEPLAPLDTKAEVPNYILGAGDALNIFVWRNPELSITVPVRPDGKISIPLIEDLQVAGRTPTELARAVEEELKKFVQDPIVTVIVTGFVGPFSQQVRVVGEAARPQAVPYREKMTVLDLMISVGGLTEFAAGNRAVLVRAADGKQTSYRVRLDDLLKNGDVSANAGVMPGDILIVPQSWF